MKLACTIKPPVGYLNAYLEGRKRFPSLHILSISRQWSGACLEGLSWMLLCQGLPCASDMVCIFQSCQTGSLQCSQISQVSLNLGWRVRDQRYKVVWVFCQLLEGLPEYSGTIGCLILSQKPQFICGIQPNLELWKEKMLLPPLLFILFIRVRYKKKHSFKAQKVGIS